MVGCSCVLVASSVLDEDDFRRGTTSLAGALAAGADRFVKAVTGPPVRF